MEISLSYDGKTGVLSIKQRKGSYKSIPKEVIFNITRISKSQQASFGSDSGQSGDFSNPNGRFTVQYTGELLERLPSWRNKY